MGSYPPCAYWSCGGTVISEGIKPEEAQGIDMKIDDGMPYTGNIQATSGGLYIDGPPLIGSVQPPNRCVAQQALTAAYAPSNTNYTPHCNLIFKFMQ